MLEEVPKRLGAVKLALGVRDTLAGHRPGALEGEAGGYLPPFQCIPARDQGTQPGKN